MLFYFIKVEKGGSIRFDLPDNIKGEPSSKLLKALSYQTYESWIKSAHNQNEQSKREERKLLGCYSVEVSDESKPKELMKF